MWIQITAGLAPVEACRLVYLFSEKMKKECIEKNISFEVVECIKGEQKDTYKSVFARLKGDRAKEYSIQNEGSILWICKSLYRPMHKRKNWFIEVEIFDDLEEVQLDMNDIKCETMRSSGNGGQNVNKLETGVRITHIPTGIVVKSQCERSQYLNKKIALIKLRKNLEMLKKQRETSIEMERWNKHQVIERGNPIRTFIGKEFLEKKGET